MTQYDSAQISRIAKGICAFLKTPSLCHSIPVKKPAGEARGMGSGECGRVGANRSSELASHTRPGQMVLATPPQRDTPSSPVPALCVECWGQPRIL